MHKCHGSLRRGDGGALEQDWWRINDLSHVPDRRVAEAITRQTDVHCSIISPRENFQK